MCHDDGTDPAKRWRSRRCVALPAAILAAAIVLAVPPAGRLAAQDRPADPETMARYGDCLARAEAAPAATADQARDRRQAAGDTAAGALATHCMAVALVAGGSYAQAATALQTLVARLPPALAANPGLRLELQIQTGHAWLLTQQPDLAEAMFDSALEADPQTAARWSDRARARADQGNWPGARADLDQALRLDPEDAGIYALRASAWRQDGNIARALEDVELALALAPHLPEALLERGLLRRAQGDLAGARQDWLQLRLDAPDSVAAETAGRLLEDMDLKRAR
ncbi:MAG: tetratricopeptide repeat protein [Sneathiellaceae bacterium]